LRAARTRAGYATAGLQARFVARDLNYGGKQQLGMHCVEDDPVALSVEVQCTNGALDQRDLAVLDRPAAEPPHVRRTPAHRTPGSAHSGSGAPMKRLAVHQSLH